MLENAWLVIKSGVPIWSKTVGKSNIDEAMAGAIIGALSMFTTSELGQPIKSVEMAGVMLHIRPFYQGTLNLVIIGDREVYNNQELLELIEDIDIAMNLFGANTSMDISDPETMKTYLADHVIRLDNWFASQIASSTVTKTRMNKQLAGITSKFAVIESRMNKEEVSIVILNAVMAQLYTHIAKSTPEVIINSITSHLKGWISTSSSAGRIVPEMIFLQEYCIGIKSMRDFYLIVITQWQGVNGDSKITNRVRSWLSQLSRRLM